MRELLDITAPAYGPYGVGRRPDGKVVLVRRGVPGDKVHYLPLKETSGMVEATVSQVVHPSPHRRAPACPVFDECGGCCWQHVDETAQLEFKAQVLRHILRSVASEQQIAPFVPSPSALGYRQRARLQLVGRAGEALKVGFFAHQTHNIVPATGCPVCLPKLSDAVARMGRLSLTADLSGSVELIADDDGRILGAVYAGQPVKNAGAMVEQLVAEAGLDGVWLTAPRSQPAACGLSHSVITVQDDPQCTIPVVPGAFAQANRAVNRLLVAHVVSLIRSVQPGAAILELYAGHGNFTFPLAAEGASVVAVETGLRPSLLPGNPAVTFLKQAAHQACQRFARKRHRFQVVLLDPPRTGAKDVVALLAGLGPSHVIYVSCDPNTFARDARKLESTGFKLELVTPFDMMPQTHHMELVGLFARG